MVKYLGGVDNKISKLIADNAPKVLSPAQRLWQTTKSFCFSAVASLPGIYCFKADNETTQAIYGSLGQIGDNGNTLHQNIEKVLRKLRKLKIPVGEIRTRTGNLLEEMSTIVGRLAQLRDNIPTPPQNTQTLPNLREQYLVRNIYS